MTTVKRLDVPAKLTVRRRNPVTGRKFRVSASTERELAAYEHRIDALGSELKLGMKSPDQVDREIRFLVHGPVTLERAALAYAERPELAPNTRRNVRGLLATHLRKLAGETLYALDGPRMAAWIGQLAAAGLEPTTIGGAWRQVSAILAYACDRGWVGSVPWGDYRPKLAGSKRAPREAARSVYELVQLLGAAADLDQRRAFEGRSVPCLEAKIATLALLGLRQGELGGLRWSDVDEGPPPTVYVARQWRDAPLKRNAPARRLQTIPELLGILESYRARLEAVGLYEKKGPIFPHPTRSRPGNLAPYLRGEVLSALNLREAVSRAGLPNVGAWSAHSLRDTFVTLEHAASGGDIRKAQARSRHASLSSFVRYLRNLSRSNPSAPAVLSLPGHPTANAEGPPVLGPTRDNPLHQNEPPRRAPRTGG